MNKFPLVMAVMSLFAAPLCAQNVDEEPFTIDSEVVTDSTTQVEMQVSEDVKKSEEPKKDNMIFTTIPQKMNIKDKIKIYNKSTSTILQSAVVLVTDDGYQVLGKTGIVHPGSYVTIASFDDNKLKQLRGKTIGVKIKGINKMIGDVSSTGVVGVGGGIGWGVGGFGVGVNHRDVKADDINNISEDDVTYDFNTTIYESSHDLIIEVGSGSDPLDF